MCTLRRLSISLSAKLLRLSLGGSQSRFLTVNTPSQLLHPASCSCHPLRDPAACLPLCQKSCSCFVAVLRLQALSEHTGPLGQLQSPVGRILSRPCGAAELVRRKIEQPALTGRREHRTVCREAPCSLSIGNKRNTFLRASKILRSRKHI